MKILIYGGKGWIGQQFVDYIKTKQTNDKNIMFLYGKIKIDNNNKDELLQELVINEATHVISFIGRTHGTINNKNYSTIDYLEQPGKLYENIRDNLYGPILLAQLCKEKNIHFTYIGTGCIFDDNQLKPDFIPETKFKETDSPNFFGSSYSIVKGFTDEIMKNYESIALNLRIRMPISDIKHPRNFITKITTYEKICSIENSMTVLPSMLPYMFNLMEKKVTGTLNFTNPGTISHNTILEMFKEIVDPSFTYENFTQEEQKKILACDRSNNYLDTTKLETLFPDVKPIEEAVKECLIEYKKTYNLNTYTGSNSDSGSNSGSDSGSNSDSDSNSDTDINTLLVTGGCGFIGSNFINYFSEKNPNIKILNLDALYYCAKESNIKDSVKNSENYTFINGNLKNYGLLKYIFQTNKISHIIHFAAQSHVQTSFSDSLSYTQDNILGTHNLLEVNRLYNPELKKFIHVSTDEVYGESMLNDDEVSKTEQSILCPTNPYAATKASAELIAKSYFYSYKMPIIITRGNNVYGPRQYPEKLIPHFITLLKKKVRVTVQGDGNCRRSFLHVLDACVAFDLILKKGKIGEIYNIGCDEKMEFSVLEIAHKLINMIIGTEYNKHNIKYNPDDWIHFIEDRPFNDKRYYISNDKLKKLGWNISVDFEKGLKEVINYYMND